MYRKTKGYEEICEKYSRMRDKKAVSRREKEPPDYPIELPFLRMRITIERYDFEYERHVLELFKTRRIDLYNVDVDHKRWKNGVGLTRILGYIRKALPRVRSIRS